MKSHARKIIIYEGLLRHLTIFMSFISSFDIRAYSRKIIWVKKKNIYMKYLFTFTKKKFSQSNLIWKPKLDVPKIGTQLSKST